MISEFRAGFVTTTEKLQTFNMHVPIERQSTSLGTSVMKRGKVSSNLSLERQHTVVNPAVFVGKGLENVKFVRHRTTDFDVWSVVPEKKTPSRGKTVPENTPRNLSRPCSEVSAYELDKLAEKKFPILGPTRQQTEIYFKHQKKKLQGLSLQGPPVNEETLKRINSEYIIRDEKHPDSVNNSTRLRNNWSNITSGSIISRKHKTHGINGDKPENLHDVRFLSELVKPLQYRLRIHEKEEKEKILFPSKYGFHRRSHSPTFRRLLEATEKLEIIAQHDTVQTLLKQNANVNEKKVASLKRPNPEIASLQTETFASDELNTPEVTARSSKKNHQTFITDDTLDENDTWVDSEFLENDFVGSQELDQENESKHPDSEVEDEDEAEDEKHSIKVDFKVAESHATLHLFLPKINSGNKSARTHKTDDLDSRSVTTDRSDPIVLPSIKVDSIHQIKSYQNPPRKLKRQDTFKKKQKKKPMERIKSAADPDKKIKDHLNDVHTLISIEDHHTGTICQFENCPYHGFIQEAKESS